MELVNGEDEQYAVVNIEGNTDEMWLYEDIQIRSSGTAEQQLQVPMDSTEPQVMNYQDFAQSPSAVGPGYNPSENYEIIILELPASMVRPLKVRQGTFQIITTFMPPPPAVTFLAFHPQDNNIIAIGMDDSSRSWLGLLIQM